MSTAAEPLWMATVRGLLALASPLWRAALAYRLRQGKETSASVRQKLMREPATRPEGALVWGHAVGVGEAQALVGLFEALAQRLPSHHFLITTTARTSAQALAGRLPPRCLHQFAPIDTPRTARAFIDHWRPDLALWCEMDLWPCLLHATAQRGVPRILINARMTPDALARKRRIRWFHAALLGGFEQLYAQDALAAQGLVALGAPAGRVTIAGSVKALARPLPCDEAELARWRARLGERAVWLAASSHDGEEATLLRAHRLLRDSHPDALLILAPRYPARGGEVARQSEPVFPTALRSSGDEVHPGRAVYVADTIGEMGLWFRLAPVAFVGGSLVAVGGHNPFEPLALGCRVLHGPTVHNFADSYAALAVDGLTQCVQTPETIARAVREAWKAGRAPALAEWRGARGAWQMVDDLVAVAEAVSAPPPAPLHPA